MNFLLAIVIVIILICLTIIIVLFIPKHNYYYTIMDINRELLILNDDIIYKNIIRECSVISDTYSIYTCSVLNDNVKTIIPYTFNILL